MKNSIVSYQVLIYFSCVLRLLSLNCNWNLTGAYLSSNFYYMLKTGSVLNPLWEWFSAKSRLLMLAGYSWICIYRFCLLEELSGIFSLCCYQFTVVWCSSPCSIRAITYPEGESSTFVTSAFCHLWKSCGKLLQVKPHRPRKVMDFGSSF